MDGPTSGARVTDRHHASAPLPAATVGTPYCGVIQITDARSGFFQVIGGSFPPGLTWNTAGAITGTPTNAGTDRFRVRYTGVTGTVTTTKTVRIT